MAESLLEQLERENLLTMPATALRAGDRLMLVFQEWGPGGIDPEGVKSIINAAGFVTGPVAHVGRAVALSARVLASINGRTIRQAVEPFESRAAGFARAHIILKYARYQVTGDARGPLDYESQLASVAAESPRIKPQGVINGVAEAVGGVVGGALEGVGRVAGDIAAGAGRGAASAALPLLPWLLVGGVAWFLLQRARVV